ncbi:hypothetical protein CRE_05818 [Caenorhabditis remanei]|uniref:Uncharacterized protein n=1 Tax=Caenorhabditis remanei TaxID=31234 RepID=E3MNH6_CAERE|nr:hypothetical protein CRE_05818 [Caenorhabditis remanei]
MLLKIVFSILALLMVTAFAAPTPITAEEEVVVGHTAIGHDQTARPTKTVFELPQTFHVCCRITNGVWKCGETCND